MSYPSFLDFEASSLSNSSYPIEVAWNNAEGRIYSYLIKPHESWTEWNLESEKIHGIPRKQIEAEGLRPVEICFRMREQIGDTVLYSDAASFERFWINRLFEAGEECESPFTISPINNIPKFQQFIGNHVAYDELKNRAQKAIGIEHRAAADVEAFMHVYNMA